VENHPFIRYLVLAMLILIVGALGSAFVSVFHRRDAGTAGVRALTIRVALSIGLFALLMVLYALGIIRPHGG
jgi:membrane protein implicated in regulation of membrane protease activity